MKQILQKLLKKRGLESTDQLDKDELKDFMEWQRILTKDDIEVADIKKFCQNQIDLIESKWRDYNITKERKAELLPYYTVYKAINSVIDAPKTEKESLEQYLNTLINN